MPSSIRQLLALAAGFGLTATIALADPPNKIEPKAPPKPEPKVIHPPMPMPVVPKVEPHIPVVPEVKVPTVPVLPIDPKTHVDPKTVHPLEHHPLVIHEKKPGGEMPKGPGLKLPTGTKIDHAELAKIKPPIDLSKTKPETVLASKPPADFKVKPMKLDSIHVPADAVGMDKLGIGSVKNLTVNNAFIINKSFHPGVDYAAKFGVKTAAGYYIFPGMWHTHWHHCIWDPVFMTYYFFDPSTGLYYYWNTAELAYYPCYWFVDYANMYYPWWLFGGFQVYGYVARPTFGIFIGW
jgi:hypothetical protein